MIQKPTHGVCYSKTIRTHLKSINKPRVTPCYKKAHWKIFFCAGILFPKLPSSNTNRGTFLFFTHCWEEGGITTRPPSTPQKSCVYTSMVLCISCYPTQQKRSFSCS
mmetsp:Transcript_42818/g.43368  ORF Transcript_42818/g.43368 Transcript_42818/m.43368 type:complete len:107 (+) Transcript_42818:1007-1327(+)